MDLTARRPLAGYNFDFASVIVSLWDVEVLEAYNFDFASVIHVSLAIFKQSSARTTGYVAISSMTFADDF